MSLSVLSMSKPTLIKRSQSSTEPRFASNDSIVGIVNHGNTCYINSIIQCLNSIDSFAQYFVIDRHFNSAFSPDSLLKNLSRLLKSLWLKDLSSSQLSIEFNEKLWNIDNQFRCNEQHDAQELLLYVLNICNENAVKRGEETMTYRLFLSEEDRCVRCPNCSGQWRGIEKHLCLSLPLIVKPEIIMVRYCVVRSNGVQRESAVEICASSSLRNMRVDIEARIGGGTVLLMSVHQSGYGPTFQDSQQAGDLLSSSKTNNDQRKSGLWNGIVALEISSMYSSNSSSQENNSEHYPTCKQTEHRNKSSDLSLQPGNPRTTYRQNGHHINVTTAREENKFTSLNQKSNSGFCANFNGRKDQRKVSNKPSNGGAPAITLVVIHVEEIYTTSRISSFRRFSAPMTLSVHKEIEFKDLESRVLLQLEKVYKCVIQNKLKSHLRFFVCDGLSDMDAEITSDHQFPLLTEVMESVACLYNGVIRIVGVWSNTNAHLLTETALYSLQFPDSLDRDMTLHNSIKKCLVDLWPSVTKDDSVESVMKKFESKRSQSLYISIEDCLKAYLSEEILDAKEAWKCTNCHEFQRATISNTMHTLPDVLILHLKRFQFSSPHFNGNVLKDREKVEITTVEGNGSTLHNVSTIPENITNNKLNVLVDYPIRGLDMKRFMSPDTIADCPEKLSAKDYYYDLVAVCNHKGTLSSGHYTAFCLNSVDHKWRFFNDDVVKEVLVEKVITPNAYILFYQRRSSVVNSKPHWSHALGASKLRHPLQGHQINPDKTDRNNGVNNRKIDPTPRKVKSCKTAIADENVVPEHVTVHKIPLKPKACNNREVVSDGEVEDDDSDSSNNGSISNDIYIPSHALKRPSVAQPYGHRRIH